MLLHDHKLVCGSFGDDTIFCLQGSARAVLFPLNLREQGESRYTYHSALYYPICSGVKTQEHDVTAAALTYLALRLGDTHLSYHESSWMVPPGQSLLTLKDYKPCVEHVLKFMTEQHLLLDGEEKVLRTLIDGSDSKSLEELSIYVKKMAEELKPDQKWEPLWSLNNDCHFEPGDNFDLKK